MYSETNNRGDHYSVGLELLASITEVEERARAVEQAVTEGYFSFDEALALYKITEQEYMTYFLLKDENRARPKQAQFTEILNALVLVYHDSSSHFDPDAKKLIREIETFTKEHSHSSL